MAALSVIGWLLMIVGAVLVYNLGGAANIVIRRVTSKPLGSLAPGYAATPTGFRTYAFLIFCIGGIANGIVFAARLPLWGVVTTAGFVLAFAITSIVAIAGEVRVYRALKR